MSKGTSQSGSSTLVNRGGRGATGAPPVGTVARRRPTSSTASRAGRQGPTNFYTDDTPGLKISPVVVIVMSLGFIGFVTVLHIIGKLRG